MLTTSMKHPWLRPAAAWFLFLALVLCAMAQQPPGTLNVTTDGTATGNGVTDDAAAIQAVLDSAHSQGKDLYFPSGTYVIGADITTREGVSLLGDHAGLSIIRSTPGSVYRVGNQTWSDPSSYIDVEDLHFLNSYLHWYGSESVRKEIDVRRCLFFGNDPAFANTTADSFFQIVLGHVVDGVNEDCVFLRQSNCPGESISGYRNVRQIYRNCVWGLHLDRTAWLETQWSGYGAWSNLTSKLQTIRTRFGLTADQGYFRRGIKINDSDDTCVEYNIFNGSPYTPITPVNRDHVIYAHGGYTDLEVLGNWMRGWPAEPNGGLKIRNTYGESTVIANYFVNTPLLQYAYDNNTPQAYEHAIIHRNHFEIYQNFSFNRLGISFWETVDGTPPQTSNEYSANTFECPKAYANLINLTNGDLGGHIAYDSNRYLSDGTPVSTAHYSGPFPLVPGAPDSSRTAPYDGYAIPDLDIPWFTDPPAFASDPLVLPAATPGEPYVDTLVGRASDPDGESLEFMKMSGPDWLSVAWDGTLSGVPDEGNIGLNTVIVRVGDNHDGMDEAELRIQVGSTNWPLQVSYAPIEDSHTSQENPDTNYGSAANLLVRNDLYNTGFRPYLKFNVPTNGLVVTDATLKLYCSQGTHTLRIQEVADTSWTEMGITWSNAPALGGLIAVGAVGTDVWEAFDVSAYVSGAGTYGFGLDSSSGSYRQVGAREGANPPVLDVVYWDPSMDTDGDGMPDWWEDRYFGGSTNGLAGVDGDGDGPDNLSEYIAHTDPTNGASFFAVTGGLNMAGGSTDMVVSWDAQEDRLYDVHWCSDMSTGTYTLVQSNMAYPNASCTVSVRQADHHGFYRGDVRLTP